MSEATGHILAAHGLYLDVRLIYWVGFIVHVFEIKIVNRGMSQKSDFLCLKDLEAVIPWATFSSGHDAPGWG